MEQTLFELELLPEEDIIVTGLLSIVLLLV
ncbi:Uncharacterised protein [Streptococcus pneumoniae]|nr:Uncharacterised protein [Streptococcus pneumoniae]